MVKRSSKTEDSDEAEGEDKEDGDIIERAEDRDNAISVHRGVKEKHRKERKRLVDES